MAWRVGMKAVCVDNRDGYGGMWIAEVPQTRSIYTVIGVVSTDDGVGLLLDEIKNDCRHGAAYAAWRFRPVHDTTHQVELLKAKLLPKPTKARERA